VWGHGTPKEKIEKRLRDERFDCVMGECDLEDTGTPSIFKVIRCETTLVYV
jgi:hypothetical protein